MGERVETDSNNGTSRVLKDSKSPASGRSGVPDLRGKSFKEGHTALMPREARVSAGTDGIVQRETDTAAQADEPEQSLDPAAPPEAGVVERAADVRKSLYAFERAQADNVHNHARWLSSNWTRFVGKTNGNPSVAYPESNFYRLVADRPGKAELAGATAPRVSGKLRRAWL